MKTSADGRALIEAREGRRLLAYKDTKGILTIGVGHTGRMSPPAVTAGMQISEGQCDEFLAADLAPVEAVLNTAVKVPLTQNEFDAMASLGFNIGAAGLKSSTVIKRLNLGDVQGAAAAFMNWSKPAVLASRRKAEMAQFLKPDPVIAAVRAKALNDNAKTTVIKAKIAGNNSAIAVAAGAGGAVLTHSSHPSFALLFGGAALVLGAGAAISALLTRKAASTMTANAHVQTATANVTATTTPI